MKIKTYVEDLKTKSAAELNDELVAAKKELFNLRFQNATNQLKRQTLLNSFRLIQSTTGGKLRKEKLLWKEI